MVLAPATMGSAVVAVVASVVATVWATKPKPLLFCMLGCLGGSCAFKRRTVPWFGWSEGMRRSVRRRDTGRTTMRTDWMKEKGTVGVVVVTLSVTPLGRFSRTNS